MMSEFKMETGYTFDDFLLVPQYSDIKSRSSVDISTVFCGEKIQSPIIPANMDTITGPAMGVALFELGQAPIFHRYMKPSPANTPLLVRGTASIGVKESDIHIAAELRAAGALSICIDVAHGHHKQVGETISKLRDMGYKYVIAGNVATYEGAKYLADCGAAYVKVGVGPGCFAGDTKILMADGTYKNIKDIKVHDRVINMHGMPVNVVGVRFSGIRDVVRYKNNIWHKDTVCTPDHKHWVGDLSTISDVDRIGRARKLGLTTKQGKSKFKWMEVGNFNGKIYPLMPKKIAFDKTPDFSIDLSEYAYSRRTMKGMIAMPTITPSYDLGFLIGTFLGDGFAKIQTSTRGENNCMNRSGNMYWYYGLEEMEIAQKTAHALESVFGYRPKIKRLKNMWTVVVRSNPIIRWFEQFGKKTQKHLPKRLFCSNKEYCRGIMDGLIDSDGQRAKDGREGFGNTSEHLAELFHYVFYVVNGYYPSALTKPPPEEHHWGDTSTWKDSYILRSVTRPDFNWTKDNQVSYFSTGPIPCKVSVPTYDIEVDCPTHSFIANHAIVHNSVCQTRGMTGHGVPQMTAIIEAARGIRTSGNTRAGLIADGGMSSPGDIAKALAAGADLVMSGYIFAGCDETPNPDSYRGMASSQSQVENRGMVSNGTPEGVSVGVERKGSVAEVYELFKGGLRSALSYSGCHNLEEFKNKSVLQLVSSHTVVENGTRG